MILSNSPESVNQKMGVCGMYTNENIDKLSTLSKNSKLVDVYGRLSFINVPKFIIPNCQITVKLDWNNEEFILIEGGVKTELDANDSTKVKIEYTKSRLEIIDAKLYVRNFEIRESFSVELERLLFKMPAIYESRRVVVKHVTIPAHLSMYSNANVYSGINPDFVLGKMI